MSKLKSVEEVAARLSSIADAADLFAKDAGYPQSPTSQYLIEQVLKQDRQAIKQTLLERVEGQLRYITVLSNKIPSHCQNRYEEAIEALQDIKQIINEVL